MTVIGSNNSQKFIFVHIPKNGGCSIAKIILPYVWNNQLSYVYDSLHDLFPKNIRSSIKSLFSVKGNPKTFLAREYLRKVKGFKSHMRAKEIKDFIGEEFYKFKKKFNKFVFYKNYKPVINYLNKEINNVKNIFVMGSRSNKLDRIIKQYAK